MRAPAGTINPAVAAADIFRKSRLCSLNNSSLISIEFLSTIPLDCQNQQTFPLLLRENVSAELTSYVCRIEWQLSDHSNEHFEGDYQWRLEWIRSYRPIAPPKNHSGTSKLSAWRATR